MGILERGGMISLEEQDIPFHTQMQEQLSYLQ